MNPSAAIFCGIIRAFGRRGLCAVRWTDNGVLNMTGRVMMAVALLVAPLQTAAQSISPSLVGAWRLVSFTNRQADGATRPSRLTVGSLIYTDSGRMCAVLMDPTRPQWAETMTATAAEALPAVMLSDAYCSRVEVNAQDGFVLHHVDSSVRPNLVGKVRKRWFKFESADGLVLKVDSAELNAPTTESTLAWQRVSK
jgi:Lipocalin-like domain